MMELNRRDMLKGAAVVATTGAVTVFADAGVASAATHPAARLSSAVSPVRMGSRGSQVLALQRRLSALGYWLGRVDGSYGDLTRQAVVTIQKVGGLSRDGVCGPLTWTRVDGGIRPRARSTRGHVIEVNKATQTLLVVDSGVVKRIYNTSTGSNQRYSSAGKSLIALTPTGSFRAFREVNAWDSGPLGRLYRPKYFNRGIAIHGYPSVPPIPASHGCCRVSLPAMNDLWAAGGLQVGNLVLVY